MTIKELSIQQNKILVRILNLERRIGAVINQLDYDLGENFEALFKAARHDIKQLKKEIRDHVQQQH